MCPSESFHGYPEILAQLNGLSKDYDLLLPWSDPAAGSRQPFAFKLPTSLGRFMSSLA